MDKEQDLVRQELLAAFPDSPGDDSTRITHEDCLETRELLPSIKDEDIAFVLKHVLLDLLDTHSIEDPQESADAVIQYLDVKDLIKNSYLGLNDEDFGALATELQQRGLDSERIRRELELIRKLDRKSVSAADKREYMNRIRLFSQFTVTGAKDASRLTSAMKVDLSWPG